MTQFVLSADSLKIAYEVVGEGKPIVLVHGFASDRMQNWNAPGWYATLNQAGYRVIALDVRGHGESDKPHEIESYELERLSGDVLAVVRAANAQKPHLMGYSMGGMITIDLLARYANHFDRAIVGGVGGTYLAPPDSAEATMTSPEVRRTIAAALREPDAGKISDPVARGFRWFADQAGKDRLALAACMSADRHTYTRDELARVQTKVLVVCGENDDRTGRADALGEAFPQGRGVTVPRRDHMTTVGDKVYKQAVLEFLAE